jgi:hypothetical protein
MCLLTRGIDPNISSASVSDPLSSVSDPQGAICLDILKDKWSPVCATCRPTSALTIRCSRLNRPSSRSSLSSVPPNRATRRTPKVHLTVISCAYKSVAKHFLASRESFNSTARHWAEAYAKPKRGTSRAATDAELAGLAEESVNKFTDMGFTRPVVVSCNTSATSRILFNAYTHRSPRSSGSTTAGTMCPTLTRTL